MKRVILFAVVLAHPAGLPVSAVAGEPQVAFVEAKAGNGELRFVQGTPVLVCTGTPAEMGEQFGRLAVVPGKLLLSRADEVVKSFHIERVFPVLKKTAGLMAATYPADHRTEIEASARAAGVDRDLLLLGYLMADAMKLAGCSTLVVEPGRSQTGKPLFGRNLDSPPVEGLTACTLVAVLRGKGKHAFASVTIAPLAGCFSVMNDAGLCVTHNTITASKDNAPAYDPTAIPTLLLIRRMIEECTTVAEAEKFLRATPRASACALTVCDTRGGAVFEVTTRTVVRGAAVSGVCCCTNHFISDELGMGLQCWRYPILERSRQRDRAFAVSDVADYLDKVNQGKWTHQSMVFEPGPRILHLAYGPGPATGKRYAKVELASLFESGFSK